MMYGFSKTVGTVSCPVLKETREINSSADCQSVNASLKTFSSDTLSLSPLLRSQIPSFLPPTLITLPPTDLLIPFLSLHLFSPRSNIYTHGGQIHKQRQINFKGSEMSPFVSVEREDPVSPINTNITSKMTMYQILSSEIPLARYSSIFCHNRRGAVQSGNSLSNKSVHCLFVGS